MDNEVLELVRSLSAIMADENAILCAPERRREIPELVRAKDRLLGRMAALLSERKRRRPNWLKDVSPAAAEELSQAVTDLGAVASENADILRRQISLSEDLLSCVKQAATGGAAARASTYKQSGTLASGPRNAPFALNTTF